MNRRLPAGLLGLCIVAVISSVGIFSPAAGASEPGACANEERRLEQGSTYLPDCRAYEMVSPVDKAGNDALTASGTLSSLDGDGFLYASTSAYGDAIFGGNGYYLGRRTASGWQVKTAQPSPVRGEFSFLGGGWTLADASDDLSRLFYQSDLPLVAEDEDEARDVYTRESLGLFSWASQGAFSRTAGVAAEYAGRSADSSHVVFQTQDHLVPADAPRAGGESVYDRVGSQTNLVNVNTDGSLVSTCGAVLGNTDKAAGGTSRAVSQDGSRIFFKSPDPNGSGDPECGQPSRLYVRINDSETIEVSAPEHVDPEGPQPVEYQGASADGSKVFFTTTEQLTADDPGHDPELYEYDLSARELTRISGGVSGTEAGNVYGVAAISPDGSHVYFLAAGQLVPGKGQEGAVNLYLYTEGTTKFVRNTLLSNVSVAMLTAPPTMKKASVSADGSRLVFRAAEEPENYHVYLYEEPTESVRCLSCGILGPEPPSDPFSISRDANLNEGDSLSRQRPGNMISADGRRVFFNTPYSLVPRDTNGEKDAYEWEAPGSGSCSESEPAFSQEAGGCIFLLSAGKGEQRSIVLDASSDGSTVFISEYSALAPQDDDLLLDVYAVRIDGGFAGPTVSAPCGEATCRSHTDPPSRDAGGSSSFAGRGNPRTPSFDRRALRILPVGRAARHRFAKTGRLRLAVRAGLRGRLTVDLQARLGPSLVKVDRAARKVGAGSTVHLVLDLSKRAKRWLKTHGLLKVKILARHSRVHGSTSAQFVIRSSGGR